MNWSIRTALVLTAGALALGSAWTLRAQVEHAREARMASALAAATELQQRTDDITFYESRVATDPEGATDRARLAALYLQRARDGNVYEDYLRADSVARASLALRSGRNEGALAVLTSALLAQHRFSEARDAAAKLVAAAPDADAYHALLGETCMETGDYDCARRAFESIRAQARTSLAVAPRLARWAELRGDTASARRIFRRIMQDLVTSRHLLREQQAWFHLRAADLELRQGRAQRAEALLEQGLGLNPADHRLLAGMARVAAAKRQWERAIRFGDSAIAIALDPATLGIVSDAYAALGDSVKAQEYLVAMEASVGQQPGEYHRVWSLFLLDHRRNVRDVLAAVQSELVNRRDIYGYDLLAWALYRNGRPPEARRAIREALSHGTHDALLFYHAGMIERAVGDDAAARAFLGRALAVSPYFEHAAETRATLDSMSSNIATARRNSEPTTGQPR
jgi:tetratricopeptide (TPR) repeat protein